MNADLMSHFSVSPIFLTIFTGLLRLDLQFSGTSIFNFVWGFYVYYHATSFEGSGWFNVYSL